MSKAKPFQVVIARRAQKDIETLNAAQKKKLARIFARLAREPYAGKRLLGDLQGYWSLRLNRRDRVVYRIDEENRIVYVLRARTHYGE